MANPTPVTLEDLIDETSLINTFNDGVETQLVSPRNLGTQRITVQVTDDPMSPGIEGVADANVANKLSASAADFSDVAVGDTAFNTETGASALVTVVDSGTLLTLGTSDIFPDGDEAFKVVAAADMGFWTQRNGGGEWKRSNCRDGNDEGVNYTLPVDTNATVVHGIVYPIALAAIATYPPITSA